MEGSSHSKRSLQRPPVIVIGAHRSGTTATARALHILGLHIGRRLDSHEEPRELRRLHNDYLQSLGASWHEPTPFLERMQTPRGRADCIDYLQGHLRSFERIFGLRGPWNLPFLGQVRPGKPWGWKEPRTTLFASCWVDLFPQARILQIVRHPLAVAASMQKRELGFQAKGDPPTGRVEDLNHCLDLAIAYMEAGRAVAAYTTHYQCIRFEDIQADPARSLTEIANFCELTFTAGQMNEAVASIRPDTSDAWKNFPGAGELLSRYPVAKTFGYDT